MQRYTAQRGITLVEVIIGIAIITISLVAIGFSVSAYVEARATLLQNMNAGYLAEEGYEIIRALRDTDWDTLAALPLDTYQYLSVSSTSIAFSNTPEVIGGSFSRSFRLQSVYRNSQDDIVASTSPVASIDTGSRELTVYVAGPAGTSTLQAILTNLHAQ